MGFHKSVLQGKPTFGNWPSWMHHHVNGSTHVDGKIRSFPNGNSFPITNAH
jgi:hypothetical protein